MKENLSVILIAHNEQDNIARMVHGLFGSYTKEILEVIVVDDASTDPTPSIIKGLCKQYPKLKLVSRLPPCGVGRAIKAGFAHVSPAAEFVMTMDSDFIQNIKEAARLIDAARHQACDGVIGSRFIKGSRMSGYPFEKKMMNRLFHVIVKVLFNIRQNDLTNNFKLYKADIVRKMPWSSDGFSINAETGILPIISGYRILEVPISWVGRSAHMGKSKFRIFNQGWGYIRVIFLVFKLRSRFKKTLKA